MIATTGKPCGEGLAPGWECEKMRGHAGPHGMAGHGIALEWGPDLPNQAATKYGQVER